MMKFKVIKLGMKTKKVYASFDSFVEAASFSAQQNHEESKRTKGSFPMFYVEESQ